MRKDESPGLRSAMYFRGRARMYRTGAHRAATDPMSAVAPAASPGGQIVIYEVEGGEARVDVRLDRDSVWLTPAADG